MTRDVVRRRRRDEEEKMTFGLYVLKRRGIFKIFRWMRKFSFIVIVRRFQKLIENFWKGMLKFLMTVFCFFFIQIVEV